MAIAIAGWPGTLYSSPDRTPGILLEAAYIFYHFCSPATLTSLCLIAALFLVDAFIDSRCTMKIFWLIVGLVFICWLVSVSNFGVAAQMGIVYGSYACGIVFLVPPREAIVAKEPNISNESHGVLDAHTKQEY
ncbi:hypothetical protein BKA65DRAFT_144996 [Rhexocercosporidium sp. MPI-PUGE-AT-0058]|nr:hypothetical protein BKA65DRAFT_144996 [Rhexocercosporidium sp. MPI-PUGE-AT-0058]